MQSFGSMKTYRDLDLDLDLYLGDLGDLDLDRDRDLDLDLDLDLERDLDLDLDQERERGFLSTGGFFSLFSNSWANSTRGSDFLQKRMPYCTFDIRQYCKPRQ